MLLLCLAVFLSYLPEAGQCSSFFVYLRLVRGGGRQIERGKMGRWRGLSRAPPS